MPYDFYLTQNGSIDRSGSTLYFTTKDSKSALPVMNVSQIIVTAKVSFSSWAIDYISKLGIPVHFLRENDTYMASLTPLHKNEQGNLTVKQVQHYENDSKRLEIASQMVLAIKSGILRNMRYYNDNNALEKEIKSVNSYVIRENSINHLLGIEGNIWSVYYSSFPKMFKDCENFKREFHPPKGPVNAMISFGNALLYSTCLSKIISANLNPSISFLHEPSDRSFSLSLDIADMFKPIIVERIIGNLLNNRMMADQDFRKVDEACYLSEHGRKKFLEQYDAKMKSTVKVGNKYYSYSSLIREECIKIEKHINTGERYNSIKSWD